MGNTRDAVGVEGINDNLQTSRFSYKGRLYQPIKSGRGGAYSASSRAIPITLPEQYDIHVRNTTTFNYTLDNDVNRLTGYDTGRLLVLGTNANQAPTTVTFGVPAGTAPSGSAWTLNGGAVAVAFTAFDGPCEFLVRFDVGAGNVVVTRMTPKLNATTAQLAAIADQINTVNKVAGRMVFNTTTGKPVWSVGATAASVWNDATGTLAHTPV